MNLKQLSSLFYSKLSPAQCDWIETIVVAMQHVWIETIVVAVRYVWIETIVVAMRYVCIYHHRPR